MTRRTEKFESPINYKLDKKGEPLEVEALNSPAIALEQVAYHQLVCDVYYKPM